MSRLVEVLSKPQTEEDRAQSRSAPITLVYEFGPECPNDKQKAAACAIVAQFFYRKIIVNDIKRDSILVTATMAAHWALDFVAEYPNDDIELSEVEVGLIVDAYAAGRTPAETARAIWTLPGDAAWPEDGDEDEDEDDSEDETDE